MIAKVHSGQLTYVNTTNGQIQIRDLIDGRSTYLHIDDKTTHPGWETLIGAEVEAIVIDDKTTKVYEIAEE